MDIDDTDAQDQNRHIAGEGSPKVTPVSNSYSLPKFEFDDSLRFHSLVDNEGFFEITSQEDNHWIEEHSSLSNVMDPKGTLESVVLGDNYNSSVGEETPDKICDDVNQEASKIATESFANDVQEDSSVSKVDGGNEGSSQNAENASGMSKNESYNDPDYIIKSKENSRDNSTNSDTIAETRTYSIEKLTLVLNVEPVGNPSVEGGVSANEETENDAGSDAQHVTSGTSIVSSGINQSEISEGIEINKAGKTLLGTCSSAENQAEVILNKDDTAGNMDIDVLGAAGSPKNVKGVIAISPAESNMDVLTDAVVAVESSKSSSPDTTDGVQLPSGTVATSDVVTEDQPRSPILGVSLLSDDNKEKVEAGITSEGTFLKVAPEVEKGTVSDGAEQVVHFDAGQSEQTGNDESASLPGPKESIAGNDESGSLPGPKKSMTGDDEAKPLNLAVNMPDPQQPSVDVDGASGCTTDRSSLDKPKTCSDTKSIELSESAKDKHDVTKGSTHEDATFSTSATKEEKNFTFEVNASSSQNLNSSMNMVSSVSSHGSQLDPIKLHEDSPVSQSPSSTAAVAGVKGKSERKPRKKSVEAETTKQSNNLKDKTRTRRSRKIEKSPPLQTPPVAGHVTPSSNPKPGDMTPIATSNLPILSNSTSVSHHSFTDNQQVELRAQILVYGSVLSGVPPEEPHMIAAFGQSNGGRKAWEATWHAYVERVRGHKAQAQPNNPGSSTPNQGIKIGSTQSKILPGISSPIVNPFIPISSPLWNIPTHNDGSQSNATPKSDLFGLYQTPGMQNFAGHNPMWLSQGPFPGQWLASSPVTSFNARFSALPITESVKLTTVKESGAPSIPVIPVVPCASATVSPMVSSGQTSSDPKSRKRKKESGSHFTTSTGLSTPVPIISKSNPGNLVSTISTASTHGQPSHVTHVDQNMEKIVTRENTVSKIEESKVQAADAAVHAATAVSHCQSVWNQLESQKNSGLVSDYEAKLASSAVSIAAAASVAKVAAAAAKIASDVAEQARLMAEEVFLSNRTVSTDQSSTTSVIAAAKEAARRRIEAASAASKHAENLDAIVKAAELAAEAVAQAGKIVAIGNPLSLKELVESGPDGYWKSPQSSSRQGHSDTQNVKTALNDQEDTGDLIKNQMVIASMNTVGSVHTSDVEQNISQSTSGTLKDNSIKEGCLVEVRKDDDKKRGAWFAANVSTVKEGKAFVCYTELQSDDGSGKLKEWVALEGEGTEPPRIRIAHPMTTMRSEGTRKRGRTTLTDYAWYNGDRVDVWCEAVVVETNKADLTSLTVQFPDLHNYCGDTPNEKRHKIGSPFVEGEKTKLSNNESLVESGRHQESRSIPLSSQGMSFDIGTSARNEKKLDTLRTGNSGLQKKQSRVVFGVPKPGKTQKFMDVSTHRVDNKNNTSSDSVKLVNYLMPQASRARGSKSNPKNDAKEKQVAEVKSKAIKSRKPPVPSFKTLTQKDKLKPSKSTSHDVFTSDENLSDQPSKMEVESSNKEDAKETSTSKATEVGEAAATDKKAAKVEVEDKSISEMEPRRSVRRIQPTSRGVAVRSESQTELLQLKCCV
ncbi:hypothetical protein M8C21_023056 [Ambrosia artemisiifolia]|uniref:Agenet-like domain-containing protein n=1 Tax=Ambrosia artemisiifolia TaxID=4212 RepID=A0AAD5BXG0_AMBAR|nr:hypothetical protein M8C21_023056 [Ambrosia artemisiifolia]